MDILVLDQLDKANWIMHWKYSTSISLLLGKDLKGIPLKNSNFIFHGKINQ
jgi:hypothetical protein